jgi:hypothetical protein
VLNCFSRSAFAPFSDADSVHANDRMSFVTALVSREDEAWRRQYGSALTLVDLNMKDAPLRLHCPADEVFGLTVNPGDKSLIKIQKAIERTGATAVVAPLGLGAHIDHLTAREAWAAKATTEVACAFYEDGAEAGVEEALRGLELGMRVHLTATLSGPGGDVAVAVKRKRKAVLGYDSQIDTDEVERISRLCERDGGRERLWANAAWMSGGLGVQA